MKRRNLVLATLVTAILFTATADAEIPTIPIALTGEPAPGTGGRTFFGFGPPALHENGQVIFGGYLDQSDFTNDLGLWFGTPGDIRLAVREGDVAPGTGGRLFEGFAPYYNPGTRLNPYHPQMNGSGKIAFRGALKGSPEYEGGGIWAGVPGAFELLALAGDPTPGVPGRTFRAFRQPFLDESGNVLFGANLDDFSESLWYHGPNGLVALAARGLPAPGVAGFHFHHMGHVGYSFTPEGQVVFTASLKDAVGNGSAGIWVGDPENPELLAAKGDNAPGVGAPFNGVFGVQMKNDGATLIKGTIGNNLTHGFWIGTPGNLSLIPGVQRDAPAPGTDRTFRFLTEPVMNDAGRIVLPADLDPVLHDGTQDAGIWTDARGSLELIVRQGDVAPGTNGALFRGPLGNTPFLLPSIDVEGTVVFQSRISTGGGIWMWKDGQLDVLVSTAMPYDVNACDTRNVHAVYHNSSRGRYGYGGIYGQDDSGRIAFHVSFQDPVTFELSAGLFVTGDDDSCGGIEPPDCSNAAASVGELWPPNHEMAGVEILGVTDTSETGFALEITGVTSDEPVAGPGNHHGPDALVPGDGSVQLRSERFGAGNGRVYEIGFTATNEGGSCSGTLQVSVPHDQSGDPAINDGQAYDAISGN